MRILGLVPRIQRATDSEHEEESAKQRGDSSS
jgi:hypothetical protein